MQNSAILVYDLTPFTLLDFPDKPACIVWLAGCNMRCPYCHNPDIVFGKNEKSFEKVVDFLKKRKRVLEGVVISGGEPTVNKNLFNICKEIKALGYKIKIDTNGSNPEAIKNLIEKNLVDYIALDLKAPEKKFELVTKSDYYENMIKTLKIINNSSIDFEVRTTVHTDLLNENDIKELSKILKDLEFKGRYFIQNFRDGGKILGDLEEQKVHLKLKDMKLPIDVEYRNFGFENV